MTSTTEESMEVANTNSSDGEEDLFAVQSSKKRAKRSSSALQDEKTTTIDPSLVEHAKKRLSKWAARLFDPDRPKGLVQPPQVIPLNDEFLTAFGKREKAFDKASGRQVEINTQIESDDDDDDDDDNNDSEQEETKKDNKSFSKSGTKVKFTNLAYRTSGQKLQQACERYGPTLQINLILDKERLQLGPNVFNSGRAYVTFEHAESAEACVDGMKELDGRQLRLSLALERPKTPKSAKNGLLNRYWDRDIGTVCYRCGQVGHIEPNCTNPSKPRPCSLCAQVDHDQKSCPCNRICFNCGCPGHVNRECPQPRGLPRRLVCGTCFQSGHHRLQCRNPRGGDASSVQQVAICMDCGKRGHFLCKELKWFYGLQGLSCFNCGSQGHSGYDCQRPNLYRCQQDLELANQEIQRAEANSIADQLEQQRQQRGRQMKKDGGNRRGNFRSMPPQRRGGGDSQRGYSQSSSSGNASQQQQQQQRGYSTGKGGGDRRNSGGGGKQSTSGGKRSRGYR